MKSWAVCLRGPLLPKRQCRRGRGWCHPCGVTRLCYAASLVPTIPAHAYAYAATFRLKDLVPAFAGAEVTIDKDRLVAKFAAEGHPAIAFAFDFGSLVLVGLDGPERDKLLRAISPRMAPEPHAPLPEDYLLLVPPGAKAEDPF